MFSDEPIQPCADRLSAYQYVQEVPGELRLTLDLKPGAEVTPEERREIIRSFHSYFPDFTLDVAIVDRIPRTSSGKFRYVIQKLALDGLSAG